MAALGDRLAVFAFQANDDAVAFPDAPCTGAAIATPSRSRNGADFGGDVVVLAQRGLVSFSTTVTFEPKRRYICANSGRS
jgi:hypothetical protein